MTLTFHRQTGVTAMLKLMHGGICTAVLNNASEVKVSHEINGTYTLNFVYPYDDKARLIKVNMLVDCEGQLFRIMTIEKESEGTVKLNVECSHVYNADAQKIHIQNIPDFIGKPPYTVLQAAFANTPFTLLGDDELTKLNLKRVDYDGLLIDFFSMDKTTPFDVMNTVIENCGKGEIYIDNYNIALVERIGADTKIKLGLDRNMQNVNVERDVSELVTRLYPYGYEDLHIGTVNGGVQYIDSPNTAVYGIREGFKDYSDYKEPEDVYSRGLWEFDSNNEERIDVPSVNISGKLIDISKLAEYGEFMKINIGDRVTVSDGDTEITERVIRLESYPYEPIMGEVSIGRVKKDLFFYLNQMGKLTRNYKKVSTSNGKVNAKAISGIVSADGVNVKDSGGTVSVLSDTITMSDSKGTRFVCGVSGGTFNFAVYDKNGRALYLSDDVMNIRGNITADSFKMGNNTITASGNYLYINGKRILTGT